MFLTWFPWRFVIRRLAHAHGFLDPIVVVARLHRFAQPAEVVAPTELLRMAAILHARGLINSQVIQHNLDWVWPYWVVRQYEPKDAAFVPRAFALTHINLTHRNWTAIGLPDFPEFPLVDPRGLLTPFLDGWSLDAWIITEDGRKLIPARLPSASQQWLMDKTPAVVTRSNSGGLSLVSRAEVVRRGGRVLCRLSLEGCADGPAWLAVSLRPYNPEGISFVHYVAQRRNRRGWRVDGRGLIGFSHLPQRTGFSHYRSGDVFRHLPDVNGGWEVRSEAGMATAAALFSLKPNHPRNITVTVPLKAPRSLMGKPAAKPSTWEAALEGCCRLKLPDAHLVFLYESALRSLVLHTPGDAFPGPFTYKRFWFRDAAFILHALLCAGLSGRVGRVLERYPGRQTAAGYFRSQEGEWDANGEALWILHRFCALTASAPKPSWRRMIIKGAQWIQRKRLSPKLKTAHAGLLPAGFSAEHLGPNDYYYWDNFWGVAGLRSAAELMELLGDFRHAAVFRRQADDFLSSIEESLKQAAQGIGGAAMPASPYRRLDPGSIGSLAAGYPLQLFAANDARLLKTAEHLVKDELVDGAFFQDIGHSGMNPYLTLHIAQVLLRAGDARHQSLMDSVARLASPTGQWPEAVHPHTGGGCMGDGQHVWASAEWVLMVRNCFVREEADRLILGSGIRPAWLAASEPVHFGPAPTAFGTISVDIQPKGRDVSVSWQGAWREEPPSIEVCLPGLPSMIAQPGQASVALTRSEAC